jgi:hypothetical protein
MNAFQLDFQTRLKEWHSLRNSLAGADIKDICIEVDRFWQQSPIMNHYLHPVDIPTWPDPWQLLNDNLYCPYARALGMMYTLIMLGIKDVDLVRATDSSDEDVILVVVHKKYIMNYYPNSVLDCDIQDFKIINYYDISQLIQKYGLY